MGWLRACPFSFLCSKHRDWFYAAPRFARSFGLSYEEPQRCRSGAALDGDRESVRLGSLVDATYEHVFLIQAPACKSNILILDILVLDYKVMHFFSTPRGCILTVDWLALLC